MRDLFRFIGWTVVDLFRSRAALEAEIWTLRQQHRRASKRYGGGTSVVGGVNPPEHDRYRGALSINMKYFNKGLEIDHASQAARIQTGVLGPHLEQPRR